MKTKKGFYLHKICGESFIMAKGVENIDFNNIIALNETACFLWKKIEGKEVSIDDMADLLMKEYDIDKETALQDCQALTKEWIQAGIME